METKTCTKCGLTKYIENFSINIKTGKHRSICRDCVSSYNKKYRREKQKIVLSEAVLVSNKNKELSLYCLKFCSNCNELKTLDDFYIYNNKPQSNCIECTKARSRRSKPKTLKPPKIKKICVSCGKELKTGKLFCSRSCASIAQHNSPKLEVTCSVCGISILRKRSHALREIKRVFCSNECKNRFYEEEGNTELICEWCGKSFKVKSYMVGKRRFCSDVCTLEWRHTQIGELHPCWTGGTDEEQKERTKAEVKEWKKLVLKRDRFTCQDCGERGGKLEVHHIFRWKHHPELRTDLDNGITLCKTCHAKYTRLERKEDARARNELKKAA